MHYGPIKISATDDRVGSQGGTLNAQQIPCTKEQVFDDEYRCDFTDTQAEEKLRAERLEREYIKRRIRRKLAGLAAREANDKLCQTREYREAASAHALGHRGAK